MIMRFSRHGLVLAAGALGLAATVAIAQQPNPGANTSTVESGEVVAAPEYRLGPEDVVEISIWKEEGLRKEVLVRPDGKLSFALVGEIQAAGRTATEIQDDITQRLKKFLSNPVVSVTVVKIAAQKIYVIGRVNKPGEFSSGRYIDVLQALAMAGGLTVFASPNDIRVMRRVGDKQVAIPFRYEEVIKGRKVEQNIVLRPGDVVVVP